MKRHISLLLFLCSLCCFSADMHWHTHFAYNNVQQIAMDRNEVYALANGKLYSINQISEELTLYTNFSGLHGTEINQLAYDSTRNQMLILYADGKVDILRDNRMQYISDLYNKQITASKKCNNVTIHGDMAYLSMEFGILSFDLNLYEFVDTYYIGPNASELEVKDVMFYGDSIYAQTSSKNYVANLKDNIVDFRCWFECSSLPKPFDASKGKECVAANGDVWRVAGVKGVERKFTTGEHVYYLPDGPHANTPYKLEFYKDKLYMLPGGRWANENKNAGHVMIYENGKWVNITNSVIEKETGKKALDFMDVAVDPNNPSRFFVSSYGTGLYEFRNNTLYTHYTPKNSIIGSAAPNNPDFYTRLTTVVFDAQNQLWITVDGGVDTTLVCFLPDGTQRGVNCYVDTNRFYFNTSSDLVIDAQLPQRKWLVSCRSEKAIVLLDDGGTSFEASDDQCKVRSEFYDQDGKLLVPDFFYTLAQAPDGNIWIGSSIGPIIIPTTVDFLESNQCRRLRIQMPDGTYLGETERINAFAWDEQDNIWIGTQTGGVYVLNPTGDEIIAHYTTANSVMPSNTILSLAYDALNGQMFIGTGMGLVSYLEDPDAVSTMDVGDNRITYGSMYQWHAHPAFTNVEEVVVMGEKVYGLSSSSLFSVDKKRGEIEYYSKLTGLSGSIINHIAYNSQVGRMLITYQDGQLDIMTSDGQVYNISDLYLKQMNLSKQVNDIYMYKDKAILAMSFGILVVDINKVEISDTYYIGDESTELYVDQIAVNNNVIYATANNKLYYANISNNLVDYACWNTMLLPSGKLYSMRSHVNNLYVVVDNNLYVLDGETWKNIKSQYPLRRLCVTSGHLYATPKDQYGLCEIQDDFSVSLLMKYGYNYDIQVDNGVCWLGTKDNGLVKYQEVEPQQPSIQEYYPDGPNSNLSYRLRFFGDKLYMLPGGRWANEYKRLGEIMIYQDGWWTNVKNGELVEKAKHAIYDIMNVAQDPNDESHYFLTTYGTGVLEMRDTSFVNLYLPHNSTLFSAAPTAPDFYTRTDGAMFDDKGNLWVLNMGGGDGNVHVMSPDGKWHAFDLHTNRERIILHTAGEILVDARNPQWKWIPILRSNTGLVLLQDNGTPTISKDDHVAYHNTWIDQNGKPVTPSLIYALAQDRLHTIWVGTSAGIFAIPSSVDFTHSNACKRVVIPRNDGSGLGDYLLDNEQINAIAVDGANRLWVGTATSGVFLLNPVGNIEDATYTVETVAHFTTENSIMPSNEVISIAIQKSTGEVFIGTGGGLVSYMSDATEPKSDFSEVYAYPNPVYPNYKGYITIKGIMDATEVRILDSSGNLVRTIQGKGGAAVWDGNNAHGQRVASGVYTALCNTITGKEHGATKILIMN